MLQRRKVDIWQHLPVPAALLSPDGTPSRTAGPAGEHSFTLATGLPPAGQVARGKTSDGTPVAVTGLRGGGGLAVALVTDPVGERRDRVLAELGSRLAHDINTPLAAILGHLDLIAHELISDTARQSVGTCQRELARLQTTAQDLLTFTRLRAGGGQRGPHFAGALAEEAAAGLLDLADSLNANLTVQVPSDRVLIDAAEVDLVRALRNLIRNALHYGLGEQRDVIVTVEATDSTVTFAVIDSGLGLTDDQLEELMQPLVRGSQHSIPGSGLGLAIVAEVLAGHGSHLATGRDPRGRPYLGFSIPRHR
jgi:signal transduction histidine kinase